MGTQKTGEYNCLKGFKDSRGQGGKEYTLVCRPSSVLFGLRSTVYGLRSTVYGLRSTIFAVICCLPLLSCGITVKEYKLKNLGAANFRVEIKNNTYEAGAAYAFKSAIEERIVKKGGGITDKDSEYEILVTLKDIKTIPLSFTKADIASVYRLEIKGTYKVINQKGGEAKTVITDVFSRPYDYSVSGIEQTEINRQLMVEQAAREIADIITDRISIALSGAP